MNSINHFWTFVHFVSASGSCQQIHLCHACVLVYMPEIMAMAFTVLCLIWRNSSGPLGYKAVSSLASNCTCSFEVLSLMSRPISSRSPTLGLCVLDTWRDKGWSSGGTLHHAFLVAKTLELWSGRVLLISIFTYFQKDGMDDNVGLAFWSDAGTNTSLWSTQRWSSSTRTTAAVGWAESNAFCLQSLLIFFPIYIYFSVLV